MLNNEEIKLAMAGNGIGCVKSIRERLNCGLKEAKDILADWRDKQTALKKKLLRD